MANVKHDASKLPSTPSSTRPHDVIMSDFRAGKPLFPLRDETAATKETSRGSYAPTEEEAEEAEEGGVGGCLALSSAERVGTWGGKKACGTDTASTLSLAEEDGDGLSDAADKGPSAEEVRPSYGAG